VLPGTEERITRALRDWHETNTFKKVWSCCVTPTHTRPLALAPSIQLVSQDCSNKDIIAMRFDDEEDLEDD